MNLLKLLYKIWMKFAHVLGAINARILLFIFFYVIISPFALIMRLFGKELLDLKLDKATATYWIPLSEIPKEPETYLHQF